MFQILQEQDLIHNKKIIGGRLSKLSAILTLMMVKPHQSLKARKYDIDKAMYTLAKMIDWRNGYGANPIDEFGLNHTYNLHNQVLPNFMVDCMALSWRFSGFGT